MYDRGKNYRGARAGGTPWLSVAIGAGFAVLGAGCLLFGTGLAFAALFFGGLAALCFADAILLHLGGSPTFGRAARILRRAMQLAFLLWLLSFIVIEATVAANSGSDPDADGADTLIVLGAGLAGETPSLVLQSRLEAAAVYLERNPETSAVLTGGMGRGEDITEAEAMRRYLVGRGVAAERLVLEERASDTIENLRFSFELVGEGDTVAVLSSETHVFRAKFIAERLGYDAKKVAAETPRLSLKLVYYIREYFSMLKVFIAL